MKCPRTLFSMQFSANPGALQPQRGMALIEVLVSLLLFSFGVLGLIGLEARSINFSVDAEDRNRAALLASEAASDMWMGSNVSLNAATLAAWRKKVGNPAQGGLPNGNGTITPLAVSGSATNNAADIVITWQAPSSTTSDTLTTRVILP